jgi:sugar phosphate isomerase/epimerase
MTLPILGAALCRQSLASHIDWLKEAPRDLELQHFVEVDVLDGDWSGLAAEVNGLLDGHQGRRGIHGPFWGFTIASYDPEVRRIVAHRMDQALDVCAAVRGTHVVIHSPSRPGAIITAAFTPPTPSACFRPPETRWARP